jgi:hypothetical protein
MDILAFIALVFCIGVVGYAGLCVIALFWVPMFGAYFFTPEEWLLFTLTGAATYTRFIYGELITVASKYASALDDSDAGSGTLKYKEVFNRLNAEFDICAPHISRLFPRLRSYRAYIRRYEYRHEKRGELNIY